MMNAYAIVVSDNQFSGVALGASMCADCVTINKMLTKEKIFWSHVVSWAALHMSLATTTSNQRGKQEREAKNLIHCPD